MKLFSRIRNALDVLRSGTLDLSDVPRIRGEEGGSLRYGDNPVRCTYGTDIEVYKSSVKGPHVWLALRQDSRILPSSLAGEAHAHLNLDQAQELVERLLAWIEDVNEEDKK